MGVFCNYYSFSKGYTAIDLDYGRYNTTGKEENDYQVILFSIHRKIYRSQPTDHPDPFPCFLAINDHSLGNERHNFINTT